MKRLFIIGLFLIIILALGASAADISLSSLPTVTAKPTKGFSTSFRVTNNGTANLTGLTVLLSTTELNNFNISFSPSLFNLNSGLYKDVTITGQVPKNINTRLSPFSGTVTVSNGGQSESVTLNVNAESQLILDNVKFIVDGKSKSISEGDTRKDVMPGSKLEIKGDVENTFTDADDIAIEDVTVEITIKDIDDGDDLEESDDVGDIDANEKESFKVEFEIPDDVDADEYTVTILVEGEDENGAKHSVEWDDVKIKIEKDKHDIRITKITVSPSKVSCSRNINVNVNLKNQGESDEDEVVVRIESSSLGIDHEDTSIPEIEEGTGDDTEYDKTYSFKIDDKVKAGTYPIMVKAYYDTDTSSDSQSVDLIVENCAVEEPPKEPEKKEEVVVVTPPTTKEEEEPEILTTPITETTEVSLLQSNAYFILLIGAIGVAVIVIIIMVIVLFSMRRRV